jgi:hypothetical protein
MAADNLPRSVGRFRKASSMGRVDRLYSTMLSPNGRFSAPDHPLWLEWIEEITSANPFDKGGTKFPFRIPNPSFIGTSRTYESHLHPQADAVAQRLIALKPEHGPIRAEQDFMVDVLGHEGG